MNGSMKGLAIVCLLGLAGCTFERYDDCESDDYDYDDDDGYGHGASPHAGKGGASGGKGGASGGNLGTGAGGTGAGGTGAGGTGAMTSGGSGGTEPDPPLTCSEERDCEPGFNCNAETAECEPSEQETCGELESEAACSNRRDCEPVYGGLNCSCGADCECQGGEPGCVCESFEFFVCRPLE